MKAGLRLSRPMQANVHRPLGHQRWTPVALAKSGAQSPLGTGGSGQRAKLQKRLLFFGQSAPYLTQALYTMSSAGVTKKHHNYQSFLTIQRLNLPALQRKGGLEVGGNLQPSRKTQNPHLHPWLQRTGHNPRPVL